jgi:NAD(P)-dependent dehydrogenase (short-subunit alcohol dehydrogenase family)
VTGAGSGIGRATALALARSGAAVVVADVDVDGANETVDAITAEGGDATAFTCDVSRSDDVVAMVAAVVDRYGTLDFAHNNAGVVGAQVRLTDYGEDEWDRIVGINLKGTFLCLQHELRHMVANRRGTIVNTASEAALKGSAADAVYTASKTGVAGLTKVAALEVAKLGVRVNAVCPGVIETAITRRIAEESPELHRKASQLMPVGRYGTPEEVADAVVWLCSDEARLVTGILLPVDGGWSAT